MKALPFIVTETVFIEISQNSLKALNGKAGLEVPLERLENGRLTDRSRERLTQALTGFVKRKNWRHRVRGYCAISARGVSLRRMTLPPSTKEELHRILLLQIESEFPLAPDELAWGYCLLKPPEPSPETRQEVLVVAARKGVVEEYSEILAGCGINAVFTLAALTRSHLCPKPAGAFAVLDIGRAHSELVSFEDGAPTSVRILAWGGENFTRSLEERLGLTRDEAERFQLRLDHDGLPDGEAGDRIQSALDLSLQALAGALDGKHTTRRLFLTGPSGVPKYIVLQLGKRLGGVACEQIEIAPGEGSSPAILGLKKSVELGLPLLLIQGKPSTGAALLARPEPKKWARLAALLAAIALAIPYAEVALLKPHLSRKLAALKAEKGRLARIDNELSFLQYLKRTQPPYLDALYVISKAASGGARFDSISINRRGEFSFRGFMMNGQQVADFRTKLLDSGFFSTVVVEDQSPTPDRQKVNIRVSAQWKPVEMRLPPTVEVPAREAGKPGAARDSPPIVSLSGPPAGTVSVPAGPPRPAQPKE